MAVPSTKRVFRVSYPASVDHPVEGLDSKKSPVEDSGRFLTINEVFSPTSPHADDEASDDSSSVEGVPPSRPMLYRSSSQNSRKKATSSSKLLAIDSSDEEFAGYLIGDDDHLGDHVEEEEEETWEDAPEDLSPIQRRSSMVITGNKDSNTLNRVTSSSSIQRRKSNNDAQVANFSGFPGSRRAIVYRRFHSIATPRRRYYRRRNRNRRSENQGSGASQSGASLIGSVESLNLPEDFRARAGSGGENKDSLDSRQRNDFHNMVVRIVNSVNITGAKSSKAAAAMVQQQQKQQLQQQQMLGEEGDDAFAVLRYDIWLGVKAWHAGVTPTQIKETMTNERKSIVDRLKEIVDYSFEKRCDEAELDVAALDVSQEMLGEEIRALGEVSRLLDKITEIEQLYPSLKMLTLDVSYYTLPVFAQRYQALCYWYNHCWTMHRQLRILASIFHISKPASAYRSSVSKEYGQGAWWQSVVKWLCDATSLRRRDLGSDGPLVSMSQSNNDTPTNKTISVPGSKISSPSDATLSSDSAENSVSRDSPAKPSSPTLIVRQFSASSYRAFVEKLLKKTAVSKLQKRLQDLVRNTPARVKRISRQASTDDEQEEQSTLHQADVAAIRYSMAAAMAAAATSGTTESQLPSVSIGEMTAGGPNTPVPATSTPSERKTSVVVNHQVSFADDRAMHEEIARIGLPSLKTTYLFLARVPLDVIHECVRFRLEQYLPCDRPSELSIRQLLKECKEVLLGAVRAIDQYQRLVLPLLGDSSRFNDIQRILSLEKFYCDIRQLLEIYFKYLSQMLVYLGESGGAEAAVLVKKVLSDEWIFIRRIVPFIAGAEAEACRKFCLLAVDMLHSISEFMDAEVKNCLRALTDPNYSYPAELAFPMNSLITSKDATAIAMRVDDVEEDDESDEEACNECDAANDEDTELDEDVDGEEDGEEHREIGKDDVVAVSEKIPPAKVRSPKQKLVLAYRTFKALYRDCRDRSLSAAYFMRQLRKDVENTTHYVSLVSMSDLISRLECHGFVMVTTPFASNNQFCAFVPSALRHKPHDAARLFNILCGNTLSPPQGTDGYLLLIANAHESASAWKGNTLTVSLPVQTLIALSQIRVDGLFLVASSLAQQQAKFNRRLGGFVKIHCEQTSPHQDVADYLRHMKSECLVLVDRLMETIDIMSETLLNFIQDMLQDENRPNELFDIRTLFAKMLHHCFVFGFDIVRAIAHLISGPLRKQHSEATVALAIKWMDFVIKNCPRGRGTKPSWANQGLEFITWATETNVTSQLDQQAFSSFKDKVQMCIIHIVGGSTIRCMPEGRIVINRSASTQSLASAIPFSSQDSLTAASGSSLAAQLRLSRPPSSSYLKLNEKPVERVRRACCQLDHKREIMLRKHRFVGHVTSNRPVDEDIHQFIKKVNFRWQKGMKIGAGQWKVYTAINLDSGQLMAMKKITLQTNAHQQLRAIADEIQNLESIQHKSLVRYFGVELHTNELLIFMEYCPGGSLAEACKVGLDEPTIRRYTRRILVALSVLHDHGIVHRDIKAANIFLTEDSVKVGDFGCSVKLQQTVTMAGDMPSMAGTIAYMSPEVIRNEQGKIGRASDIWALGCVIIEMVTGLQPWHELENQYQIMYKVGMGHKPTIPEHLSLEGRDFLKRCFNINPRQRASAHSLLEHPFVKVSEDDA